MAHLTTNLMSSDCSINVYCEEIGAYLRISTGGKRFVIQVMGNDSGDIEEEFVSAEYEKYPNNEECFK